MSKHLMTTIRMLQMAPLKSEFYQRLYVGNLPWTVGDTELSQHFSKFGKVAEAKVQFDPESQRSRSFPSSRSRIEIATRMHSTQRSICSRRDY